MDDKRLRKLELELIAMQAVLQLGNDAYGSQVQDELKETPGREIALGAIYTPLARLEEQKLVTSRLADLRSYGVQPQHFFRITTGGTRVCEDSREALYEQVPTLGVAGS